MRWCSLTRCSFLKAASTRSSSLCSTQGSSTSLTGCPSRRPEHSRNFLADTNKSDATAAAPATAAAALMITTIRCCTIPQHVIRYVPSPWLNASFVFESLTSTVQVPKREQVQILACGPDGHAAQALWTCGYQESAIWDGGAWDSANSLLCIQDTLDSAKSLQW